MLQGLRPRFQRHAPAYRSSRRFRELMLHQASSDTLQMGKLIGAESPLRPNQVWSIRTRLLIGTWTRDLALFNLAID
jgi:hypothetical protein